MPGFGVSLDDVIQKEWKGRAAKPSMGSSNAKKGAAKPGQGATRIGRMARNSQIKRTIQKNLKKSPKGTSKGRRNAVPTMASKDRRFAGGRRNGDSSVRQSWRPRQQAAQSGKARGRVDRRSSGAAKGTQKGSNRFRGQWRRMEQQQQLQRGVRRTIGRAKGKGNADVRPSTKRNDSFGWQAKGSSQWKTSYNSYSNGGGQGGWRDSDKSRGSYALEFNRKSRDASRWIGKGSISDTLAKGAGKGKGRQDMRLSDEDRRLMQKISIVAHMDNVPKPTRSMQGLAGRAMSQIIGNRSAPRGASRGLGSRVGGNFER
mmetsp:Transcript_54229/g.100228  ORF Transcript_54229/g.100228 Transcript_54229/m.100228 type:complete len:315 (-) Transcript_54229:114-1058(-)